MAEGGAQFWTEQFVKQDGSVASGVQVYHYAAGTMIDKTVWVDEYKSTAAPQPVIGDSAGRVSFYGDGEYRLRILDSDGIALYDWTPVRITKDTATLWEDNQGTAYPPANAFNKGQLFMLVDGSDVLQELGLNVDGTAFTDLLSIHTSSINVKDPQYGAVGDGITDDTAAVQAAIDAASGSIGPISGGFVTGNAVIFPNGTYLISSPLTTVSGVSLIGYGPASRISASSSFAGSALIRLEAASGDRYSGGLIHNLGLLTIPGSGTPVIQAIAGTVTDSQFTRLYINAAKGLDLSTYTQAVVLDTIYITGYSDQVLYLKGNFNIIRNVNRVGNTGSTSDPYILIEAHSTSNSTGIYLENILLQGGTSATKSGIKLDGVTDCALVNYWWEPTVSDGYMLRIVDSAYVTLKGYVHGAHPTTGKIKIDTTREVHFQRFDTDGQDAAWPPYVELDATSTMYIDSLQTRRGSDLLPLSLLSQGVGIRQTFNRQIFSDAATGVSHISTMQYLSGQNLLVNPSFEAGRYGWTFNSVPTLTEEYIASAVGQGLMGHFLWSSAGTRLLTQTYTVPAAAVNTPMTLSYLVNVVGGTAGSSWAYAYVNGAGITASSAYNRVNLNQGWQIATLTVRPPSAGAMTVGIASIGVSEMYVDEAVLSVGPSALVNSAKFGSFELNNTTHATGTAAPTTGTWKQGDFVWNTAPTGSTPIIGWSCTVAGSPGTWVAIT